MDDAEGEVDLSSAFLEDLLSDEQVHRPEESQCATPNNGYSGDQYSETGGEFKLGPWVSR